VTIGFASETAPLPRAIRIDWGSRAVRLTVPARNALEVEGAGGIGRAARRIAVSEEIDARFNHGRGCVLRIEQRAVDLTAEGERDLRTGGLVLHYRDRSGGGASLGQRLRSRRSRYTRCRPAPART